MIVRTIYSLVELVSPYDMTPDSMDPNNIAPTWWATNDRAAWLGKGSLKKNIKKLEFSNSGGGVCQKFNNFQLFLYLNDDNNSVFSV